MPECLLIGVRGGGGEETFVRSVEMASPEGFRYTVVLDHHESVPGARARRIAEVSFNRVVHPWIWPLSGLRAYRVDTRFDIVHVHNHLSHIRSARDVPVVMTVGGGSYHHYIRDYMGWPEVRVDRLYRRARTILGGLGVANEVVTWGRLARIGVWSEFSRQFLLRAGVPESRIDVLVPGIADPSFPSRRPDPYPFTFLFIGRHPQRKGADLVIEAVRSLRARGRDVLCRMVGDPSFAELRGEPGFEVRGWADRHALYHDVYPRGHALLIPSRVEGYGLVVLEAMSFGLPVVATSQGAFPEILGKGDVGILVPTGDGGALEDAMEALCRDPEAARAMGLRGRRRFEAEFTLERLGERMGAFYRKALGKA